MSKIYADTIETENPNVDITLGATGDAVLIPTGATLKTNKIADAGGNNIITSDGSGNLTVDSQLKGGEVLLATNTFTDAASSSFTSLIDSTYNVYKFEFNAINPVTDAALFTFNGSIDAGSNYNVIKTSTFFRAIHNEGDTTAALQYMTANDEAQSTAFQDIVESIGSGADECAVGELHLFNPSSTTYVKQFFATTQSYHDSDFSMACYVGGYFNTTSALDAISFKMSSGNMDGEIKMYGLSTS